MEKTTMKSDITRDTFDPTRQYSRVLLQQGRVQLDADWNEQVSILLHYLRTLAADIIGPHGGPRDLLAPDGTVAQRNFGFEITVESANNRVTDLNAGTGRYYVDGLLCENYAQPDGAAPDGAPRPLPDLPFLAYLDVWERHVTALEDDAIREKALGGADTATRAQVVWQVKTIALENLDVAFEDGVPIATTINAQWSRLKLRLRPEPRGLLQARVGPDSGSTDPCIVSPTARYRGLENQLYRVEVHQGSDPDNPDRPATFKWSRDNGSVLAAWEDSEGNDLVVTGVHDQARGFAAGQWVELSDDDLELRGEPGTLVQLVKVEGDRLTFDPATASGGTQWDSNASHPKVRRWDQRSLENQELSMGA
ncbi:MAG TPA: DUF6519 domain-containing protein, partial [Abditibacteriaceae bacterium]|nr:DUF6519 domain-containing protein [Abditibacteriaceae bacterium]